MSYKNQHARKRQEIVSFTKSHFSTVTVTHCKSVYKLFTTAVQQLPDTSGRCAAFPASSAARYNSVGEYDSALQGTSGKRMHTLTSPSVFESHLFLYLIKNRNSFYHVISDCMHRIPFEYHTNYGIETITLQTGDAYGCMVRVRVRGHELRPMLNACPSVTHRQGAALRVE